MVDDEIMPKASERPADESLASDLACIVSAAKSHGASDAVAVPASCFTVDERVRMKCHVPRCPSYGKSGNCPPHVPGVAEVRAALARYRWAILFKIDERAPGREVSVDKAKARVYQQHAALGQIVCKLESLAFRRGYHLAMGLGAGSCVHSLCASQPCQLLASGTCRHPLESRPSMEALGIDVFHIARKVGWPILPVDSESSNPDATRTIMSIGVVFVC